jgi:1-deoxy-D-xylulose-5-phosphate synthase
MSISRNVGALSGYLNRLRTDPSYSRTKEEIETVLNRIPRIGSSLASAASRFKDKVKYLMVPGILFEELGFTYIGPVDGHNLQDMTLVMSNAKRMKGPILIHTITQKGRGYGPALENPDVFHGVGPFDIDTGSQVRKPCKTYTQLFGDYMVQKAQEEPRLVAITAAMASGTGLSDFALGYPERFFDVGICEQHAVTMAAGMAKAGLKPVVSVYSTFLQRAFDQVIHDVALQNLPVVFAVDRAGLVGEDGATHQGAFDLAYLRIIPNLTIMAPADGRELTAMLDKALEINGPVAIRYPRGIAESVGTEPDPIEIGQGRIIQDGRDLAIIAIGRGVKMGRELAGLLNQNGISAMLYDARFAKPLDREGITGLARRFTYMVTIEDNCLAGGFASSILELMADEGLHDCQLIRIGLPDDFVEHGRVEQLFEYLGMDPAAVLAKLVDQWPKLTRNRSLELLKFGEK